MAVHIQRHVGGSMAKHPLDHFDICPRGDGKGRRSVPQDMDGDWGERSTENFAGFLYCTKEDSWARPLESGHRELNLCGQGEFTAGAVFELEGRQIIAP